MLENENTVSIVFQKFTKYRAIKVALLQLFFFFENNTMCFISQKQYMGRRIEMSKDFILNLQASKQIELYIGDAYKLERKNFHTKN